MNSKHIIYLFMVVGSTIGSFLPTLWGDTFFSLTSVFLTAFGGILGIWIGFKISRM